MNARRVALVTGAGGGIGGAVCDALAQAGCALAAVDVDGSRATVTAARLVDAGGEALAIPCDVAREDDVERAVSETKRRFGAPSMFVHAAGIGGPFHGTDEVSLDEWRRIFDANVTGAFLFARRLLPPMRAAGFGRIVTIASIQGLFGARLSSTYAASKHALVGYTRAIAAEWGAFGITCNAVCPGYVDTPMGVQPGARPGHDAQILARTPTGRVATPQEIASLVRYLVSDEARHVNGAALVVDGGITADVGI